MKRIAILAAIVGCIFFVTTVFAQENNSDTKQPTKPPTDRVKESGKPATDPVPPTPPPVAQKLDQAWQKLVTQLDTNKDGMIAKDEAEKSETGFQKLDKNADGFITAEDLPDRARQAKGPKAMQMKAGIKNQILKMDTDKDGKVSKDEWSAKKVQLFSKIDTNGDGSINKEEFEKAGKVAKQFSRMLMMASGMKENAGQNNHPPKGPNPPPNPPNPNTPK